MNARRIPTPTHASGVPLHCSVLRRVAAGWIVFRFVPGRTRESCHLAYPMFWHGPNHWVGSSTPGELPDGTVVFPSDDAARDALVHDTPARPATPATEQEGLFV